MWILGATVDSKYLSGDENVYFTEQETAEMLKVSPRTLEKWRAEHRGLHWHRFEGSVRYALDDIKKYREQSRVEVRENK